MRAARFLSEIHARLREPSTYATLTGVLALVGVKSEPGMVEVCAQIGMAVAAVLGIVLAERGTKVNAEEKE